MRQTCGGREGKIAPSELPSLMNVEYCQHFEAPAKKSRPEVHRSGRLGMHHIVVSYYKDVVKPKVISSPMFSFFFSHS